ncbi:MAG TPA: carboxypeptidase regulatory-like domain-containing protein [Povalibacter sp.]|uniref:carboxypeptidase regulatory-like domain-containing protein n=1 Tax=Povalibacter sp. TaxID=1962978 RepID=UPI002CECA22A|nr:carboxypeptidase regulatory-like domain-containing protein [Povalibacter sp.]HMN43127.1 carboxypeptidase regulatory-like domain-containing protein [Povalibacter sp.]
MAKIYRVLAVIWMCALCALDASASADWLLSQQQADGSVASATDVAIPFQSSAEAVRTLRVLGREASVGPAQAYLGVETYRGTEHLSRQIIAAADAGSPTGPQISELLTHQNSDGGFGELPGYQSSPLDTAFALEALAASGNLAHAATGYAVGFLLQNQRSEGGWSLGEAASDLYVTSIVARALHAYRARFTAVSSAVGNATGFLLSRRVADALWGEDALSAQSLLTLATVVADVGALQASGTALRARRSANTSWSNDVYTTALALRALYVFDARVGGVTTPESGGVVTGHVLRSGTSAPIEGAVVTSAAGGQVLTNAEGHFALSGIAAGETTLTIGKAGYASVSRAVSVRNGQFTNAGTVLLAQLPQLALVRGRIVDAHDGSVLGGVNVSLSGPGVASASSNALGEFEIANLPPGSYSVRFERTGYRLANGMLDAPAGSVTAIQQGLTRDGAFLDESPIDVAGRIVDGISRLPLAGAQLTLDGVASGASGNDGSFELAALARGNHRLEIGAAGYAGASYSFLLPAGAVAPLGDLALYAATPEVAATTLTLTGVVVDGLDNRPLPNATISIAASGATLTSDAQGRFVASGLTELSFDVLVAAEGHETRSFALTASGFGEVNGTFALPPVGGDPQATASTLRGFARDSVSAEPLGNVSLRIAGTNAAAVSAADGSFEIAGVDVHEFSLSASLSGYSESRYEIELAQHGTYAIDVSLVREPGAVADLFDVVSVVATATGTGANTQQRFVARVTNLSDGDRSALVIADVFDASDAQVASVTPFAVGTETPATLFGFAAGESLDLEMAWNTAQFAPGQYRMRVRVVEPGTVTRELPSGVVLALGEGGGTVTQTLAITGGLALTPPLAQSGSTQPVQLSALVMNQGNLPLTGESFTLSVLDPQSGDLLHSAQATAALLEVGDSEMLEFGSWVPTRAGDLPVMVVAQSAATTGSVNGVLYVGDKATGTFTVDRSVVPMGTQTVRASISMRGVDVRTGTSTDPLFLAVKEAVRKGGLFVAQQAPLWNETNRCLGCHTQTQSIMGLAASLDKTDIDRDALQYLYNDIVGSQQANGALHASHLQHASVQTALATWSLSAWPDTQQVFRSMYKAASYQLTRLSTSGTQSWWSNDHCGAWWCNTEGPTMAATKGIAATLRMAQELQGQSVPDYGLEAAYELGSPNVMDVEQAADGTLWYLEYNNALYVRNLQTGERRTVATGITNAYGLAVAADSTAYVTSGTSILRFAVDGTRTILATIGGTNLLDIVLGPDGFLYVSDYQGHRIFKVSQAGTVTTFLSGGLLAQPVGLVFDEEGSLYVANYGRFNILKVSPAGVAAPFARGLAYQPVWLRRTADGTLYANSAGYSNSGFTPSGVWRIAADGYVERMVTMDSMNSYNYGALALIDGNVYASHEASRRLYRLVTQPLATPQLTNMQSALERVVRYTLARYTDNSQWNDLHAMRLITLAEARPYVSDLGLQAQIDTAITYIANLLRQRQRADGGWAYIVSRTVSDPYATAFVGLALEYTHPSVNDPAIRNSITYLLNQQQADFSWNYTTGVFPTKLGPTSFVMAYLPLALERLGGIDTDLTVVMPADVLLSNPSQAPASQVAVTEGTQYKWSLQGVTNNARTISFDATLADLGYQEERAVAAQAYLEFKNSFTEETLRSDLVIPVVRAASDLVLALSTDEPAYAANANVGISSNVTNAGPPITSGELRLVIRAADGALVADLGSVAVGALETGAAVVVPSTWNTGTVLAGGYAVHGELYNQASVLVSESQASFQVVHVGAAAGASIATDKPVYAAWDAVQLNGRIRNLSENAIQAPTTAELTVRTPSGQVIFTRTFSLTELGPQALRDVTATLNLSDAVTGDYSVELVVRDGFSHAVVATASGQFAVERDELQALRGRVSVQSTRIERGAANVCIDTASNVAATAYAGVVLTQSLVSLEDGSVVQTGEVSRDFAARQEHVLTRSVATTALPLGGYACVLNATYQGRTVQIGSAGFEVIAPSIQLEAVLRSEGAGRLLVLLDESNAWPCTSVKDVELWAPFRTRLPTDARIEVELLDEQGRRGDVESGALAQYRGAVNQRKGGSADLSITGVSAEVLTVKIASNSALGSGYRMVATATAESLPPLVVESNVMGESCGWKAGHGARFGDFHCSGGRTRSGGSLPPPLLGLPTLAQQRAFLEQELDAAGESYTIVTEDEAFERQLRTGVYSRYALFAEHEKLDEQVQKELREAVYRGEGLLDAGQHDHRHHGFDAALGITPLGRQVHVSAVTLAAPWSEAGTASLSLASEALRIRLNGAQSIARFKNVSSYDTAATSYSYGRGKSVYVGYDLLAEATLAGSTSLHAALLRNALVQIAPSDTTRYAGQVVPLRLTVTNRSTATPGRAVLPLPAGVTLIDPVEAEVVNNALVWTFDLAANAQQTFTAWVRLPDQAGAVNFDAQVQSGGGGSYLDQAHALLSLQAQPRATLAQAITLSKTSIRFLGAWFWLEKTQWWLDRGCEEFALASLVQASSEAMQASHAQSAQLRLMIDGAIWELSRRVQ